MFSHTKNIVSFCAGVANGTINFLTETSSSTAVVQVSSENNKLFGLPQDNVGNMPNIEEQMRNLVMVNISSVEGICPGNCSGNGLCTSFGVCLCSDSYTGQNCSEGM